MTNPTRDVAGRPRLERATFTASRLLDFFSEKELIAQTGHPSSQWPLVILKELVDNALDACEEAGVHPEIEVTVDEGFQPLQPGRITSARRRPAR